MEQENLVGIHPDTYLRELYGKAVDPETGAHNMGMAHTALAEAYLVKLEDFWKIHPEEAPQIAKDQVSKELEELVKQGNEESFKLAIFKEGARALFAESIKDADNVIIDTVGNEEQQAQKLKYLNPAEQATQELIAGGMSQEEATLLVRKKLEVHIHAANKHQVIEQEIKMFKALGYRTVLLADDKGENIAKYQEIGRATNDNNPEHPFQVLDYYVNNDPKQTEGDINHFGQFMRDEIKRTHEQGGKVAVIWDWDDTLYDESKRVAIAHQITERLINQRYIKIASVPSLPVAA